MDRNKLLRAIYTQTLTDYTNLPCTDTDTEGDN